MSAPREARPHVEIHTVDGEGDVRVSCSCGAGRDHPYARPDGADAASATADRAEVTVE